MKGLGTLSLVAIGLTGLLAPAFAADLPSAWPNPPEERQPDAHRGLTGVWECWINRDEGTTDYEVTRIVHDTTKGVLEIARLPHAYTRADGKRSKLEHEKLRDLFSYLPQATIAMEGNQLNAVGPRGNRMQLTWDSWNVLVGTFTPRWSDLDKTVWSQRRGGQAFPASLDTTLSVKWRRLEPMLTSVEPAIVNMAVQGQKRTVRITLRGSHLPVVRLVGSDYPYTAALPDPHLELPAGSSHFSSNRSRTALSFQVKIGDQVRPGGKEIRLLGKAFPNAFVVTPPQGSLEIADAAGVPISSVRWGQSLYVQARLDPASAPDRKLVVELRNKDEPGKALTLDLFESNEVVGLYRSTSSIQIGGENGDTPRIDAIPGDDIEARFVTTGSGASADFLRQVSPRVRVAESTAPISLSFFDPKTGRSLSSIGVEQPYALRARLQTSPSESIDEVGVTLSARGALHPITVTCKETGPMSRLFVSDTLGDQNPFPLNVGDQLHANLDRLRTDLNIFEPAVTIVEHKARWPIGGPMPIAYELERCETATLEARVFPLGSKEAQERRQKVTGALNPENGRFLTDIQLPRVPGKYGIELLGKAGETELQSPPREFELFVPPKWITLLNAESDDIADVSTGYRVDFKLVGMSSKEAEPLVVRLHPKKGEGKAMDFPVSFNFAKKSTPFTIVKAQPGHYELELVARAGKQEVGSRRQSLSFYQISASPQIREIGVEEAFRDWQGMLKQNDASSTYEMRLELAISPALRPDHAPFLIERRSEEPRTAYVLAQLGHDKKWVDQVFSGVPRSLKEHESKQVHLGEIDAKGQLPFHCDLRWGVKGQSSLRAVVFSRAGTTLLGDDNASVIAGAALVQFREMLRRLKTSGQLPADFDENRFKAEAAAFAYSYGKLLAKEMKAIDYGLESGGTTGNNMRQTPFARFFGFDSGKTCGAWQQQVFYWFHKDFAPRHRPRYLQVIAAETPEYTAGIGEHHLCWLVLRQPDKATRETALPSLRAGFSLDPWRGVTRYRSWDMMKKKYPELEARHSYREIEK